MYGGPVETVGFTLKENDEGYIYIFDGLENGPTQDEPNFVERFADLLADYNHFPKQLLPRLTSIMNCSPIEIVAPPSPWYQNRITVIGDAAYAGPPRLARRATMSIEDAVVLAEPWGPIF
jgi:2-polyprenyl-6-methoxyphenol hydroxylase-like FAD-dependent oxidoreductase